MTCGVSRDSKYHLTGSSDGGEPIFIPPGRIISGRQLLWNIAGQSVDNPCHHNTKQNQSMDVSTSSYSI